MLPWCSLLCHAKLSRYFTLFDLTLLCLTLPYPTLPYTTLPDLTLYGLPSHIWSCLCVALPYCILHYITSVGLLCLDLPCFTWFYPIHCLAWLHCTGLPCIASLYCVLPYLAVHFLAVAYAAFVVILESTVRLVPAIDFENGSNNNIWRTGCEQCRTGINCRRRGLCSDLRRGISTAAWTRRSGTSDWEQPPMERMEQPQQQQRQDVRSINRHYSGQLGSYGSCDIGYITLNLK